ncbi:hypothetical protein K505DRAFT_362831 [Melanomma pulvis-pyrius CBS 109.77]|uniref:Uncharacterized protein n=1 Tax=Melanomma pulvis-pyrius CBS 109.77 TaxID=1314802 RepID=A0A6A6X9R9_9PLEO|nr:hypothetical protein K505DRAFT_362831 [Melanomma pulvis-pyrius CBS 109.77]
MNSFTNDDGLRVKGSDQMHSSSNNNCHEAKTVVMDHEPSAFRFLDLHAELRNYIYEYAVEQKINNVRTGNGTRLKKAPAGTTANSLANANHTHESTRAFFGLTQVNRQIRSEYRPLYLKQNAVYIEVDSIPEYIETFYPMEVSHPDYSTNYGGSITITIAQQYTNHPIRVDRRILINPFLKLIFNNENAQCTFSDNADARDLIEIGLNHRAAWESLMDDGVEIFLELRYFRLGVILTLKAADEFWDRVNADRDGQSLMDALGLGARSRTQYRLGDLSCMNVFPLSY